MRNKISCSAKKLSQLEPDMVYSVVGAHVFKLGKQYHSENRVRITESHEFDITSEVDGTYGVYAQAIHLDDGILSTTCSCPATEQPFCRHCVAVLLDFYSSHNSLPLPESDAQQESLSYLSAVDAPSPPPPPSGSLLPDLKFHEVSIFIGWIQSTVHALTHGNVLPQLHDLGHGEIRNWAEAIQDIRDRYERSEEACRNTGAELQDCQKRIVSLTQDFESLTQEAKDAKTAGTVLRRELEDSRETLERYAEIAKERDQYIDQLNSMRGELLRKGADLDSLIGSLKQVSTDLQAVTLSSQ